jgi:hypothetical protein
LHSLRNISENLANDSLVQIYLIFSDNVRIDSLYWHVNWRHSVETNIAVLLLEDPFLFNAGNGNFFKSLKLFKQQNEIEKKLITLITTVYNLKYEDTTGNQVINCLLMSRNQVINSLPKSSGNQVINYLSKSS